jgi:hypothetical protein
MAEPEKYYAVFYERDWIWEIKEFLTEAELVKCINEIGYEPRLIVHGTKFERVAEETVTRWAVKKV